MAEFVDNFVRLLASADHIANVDGVVATRCVLLNILDAWHSRLEIPEGGHRL